MIVEAFQYGGLSGGDEYIGPNMSLPKCTSGCPCDACPQYAQCAESGNECHAFTAWVNQRKDRMPSNGR